MRDAGETGVPRPYEMDMAMEAAPPPIAQTAAPPVPPGLTTSQVVVRVDFAPAE